MPIERPKTYKKIIKGKEVTRMRGASRLNQIKEFRKNLTKEHINKIRSRITGEYRDPVDQNPKELKRMGLDARQMKARAGFEIRKSPFYAPKGIPKAAELRSKRLSAEHVLDMGRYGPNDHIGRYSIRDLLLAGYSQAEIQRAIKGLRMRPRYN